MTPEQLQSAREWAEHEHPMSYTLPADRFGGPDTFLRCPQCEQWSPCYVRMILAALDDARAELAMCEPSDAEATAEVARLNAANARLRVALELCIPVFDVLALIDPLHSTRIADTLRAALKGT